MFKQSDKQEIPIFLYHSVSNDRASGSDKYTISPARFADHMAYLARNHYRTITVTQFVKSILHIEDQLPERSVILTFDDAFEDFYTNVLPILKRYEFVATLYVPTQFVGQTDHGLRLAGEKPRRFLSWPQLLEIGASGIECGAHSHSHVHLDMVPSTVVYEEIVQCKKILETQLSQEVVTFAYPYGHYTASVRAMVETAGYSSACAIRHAMSSTHDDRFALARLLVEGDMSLHRFAGLLTGRGHSMGLRLRRLRSWARRCTRRGIRWIQVSDGEKNVA